MLCLRLGYKNKAQVRVSQGMSFPLTGRYRHSTGVEIVIEIIKIRTNIHELGIFFAGN